MFHADFPLQFPAGLHGRPQGHLAHLGQLYGLTIDGKKLHPSNPEMAEYESPNSSADRVVRVAANSGDPEMDKRIVQYAKATIQSGDGPYRGVMHPFLQEGRQIIPQERHKGAIMGAVGSLEQDPGWQPYVQVAPAAAEQVQAPKQPGRHDWLFDPEQQKQRAIDIQRAARYAASGWHEVTASPIIDALQVAAGVAGLGLTAAGISFGLELLQNMGGYGRSYQGPTGNVHDMAARAFAQVQQQHPEDVVPKGSPQDALAQQGATERVDPGEHPDPDSEHGGYDFPKESGWEVVAMPLQDFQTQRGDFGSQQGTTGEALCPACGTMNAPGATQCMKCGAKIGLTQPSHSGGPSDAHSNPYTGNPLTASTVISEMSKWHLADIGVGGPVQQQPDTQDGAFNDHRDVGGMSHEQAAGHERLVNIVVDEMNKALTQGAAIDATLVQNLVQWLVDKFGQDADSAQAIVDAASKQAQTSDGRLDTPVVPDPAEQAIQPTQGDVVTDPSQEQNSGAFQGQSQSHVRTPSGRVGHVTDSWQDMYGEKWSMVECFDGFKESVYDDDLVNVEEPEKENAIAELQAFMDEMEPVEASVSSVKARIANLRIVKQEIRRHMTNERLSLDQKYALDQMDADASVDMLALTDAVTALSAKEEMYLASQPKFALTMTEDVQPTLYGVEHLAIEDAPEPEWTNEALDAFLPEEADVMVSELDPAVRADTIQLEAVAASFVDELTIGHVEEDRARHRSRFIAAAKSLAADYSTTDAPDTTEEAGDWDGPAEGIFA